MRRDDPGATREKWRVRKADVSFKEGSARVLYDPAQTDESRLIAAIEKGGYKVASTA